MTDTDESLDDGDAEPDVDGTGLPADVIEEAERLTRIARETPDENEATARRQRRDELLAPYDYTARIRDDDGDDVLVCHPAEWHDDAAGVIRTDRIDDLSRAVEIPLEGTGDPDEWDRIDAHNRDLAKRVRTRHGDVHGDTATALADFVSNHYAKRLEELTAAELREFREEYFVRNAWPSDDQRDVVDESIELVFEMANRSVPGRTR